MNRVCGALDVPLGEGRVVAIEGRRIAVFRTRHGWYALGARCPHRGGPLTDGIVADGCVICPLHDRRFDLATGRCHNDPAMAVDVHRVELRGDEVWVDPIAVPVPGDGSRAVLAA